MAIEVRAAHRADAVALGAFITTAWREAGPGALGFAGASDNVIADLAELDTLRSLIAEETTTVLIASSGFVIVGFAAVRTMDAGGVELAGIVVGGEHQGQGVGTALVEAAFEVARELEAEHMVVRTESGNRPAIRFYESQGFTHLRHIEEMVGDERMTLAQLTATIPASQVVDTKHPLWDATCIFCRILDGEAPASFVYQDDQIAAFMDLYPVTPGHLLVVPREHRRGLRDLPPELGAQMFTVAQLMTDALWESDVRTEGFNLFLADGEIAMQEVPHAHLHVIPRFPGDGFGIQAHRGASNPSRTELDRQAASIRALADQS